MPSSPDRPDNTVICWCNKCRLDTLHDVVADHGISVPGMVLHGKDMGRNEHYMIVKCRGCIEVHFLKVRIGSEDTIWAMGYEHPFDCPLLQSNFPPRNIARQQPAWIENLDADLRDLIEQTYRALHSGADRLAVMGTRAILEWAIIDKCNDQGTFTKNVSKFIDDGYLAESNRDAVIAALDVGSAAIHRAYSPDLDAISDVFEIVESIIHSVYIVPESGLRSNYSTPSRN